YISFLILTFIVLGSIAYAFSIVGLPVDSRKMKFDETRSSDLISLKYSIDAYYRSNRKLPTTLTDLKVSTTKAPSDPETSQTYDYKPDQDSNTYQLCATFGTDTTKTKNPRISSDYD